MHFLLLLYKLCDYFFEVCRHNLVSVGFFGAYVDVMGLFFLFLRRYGSFIVNDEFSGIKAKELLLEVEGPRFRFSVTNSEIISARLEYSLGLLEHTSHIDERIFTA